MPEMGVPQPAPKKSKTQQQQEQLDDLERRLTVVEEKLAASEERGQQLIERLKMARAKQLVQSPEVQDQLAAAFAQRMSD